MNRRDWEARVDDWVDEDPGRAKSWTSTVIGASVVAVLLNGGLWAGLLVIVAVIATILYMLIDG